jgi:transcriptional regulator with XRE-family HTH domain
MSDSGNVAAMGRELGRQLAALRRQAGLAQRGLAALAGFSRTTVSMAEIGRACHREFWEACDKVLDTGGALTAGADQIDAVRDAERRAAARAAHDARQARAMAALATASDPSSHASRGYYGTYLPLGIWPLPCLLHGCSAVAF